MGMRAKPTALKKIQGNPGRRPYNKREPVLAEKGAPRGGWTAPPSHLTEGAKAEWTRLITDLREVGLVTRGDRATFAAYCIAYDRWVKTEEKMEAEGGPFIFDAATKTSRPHPLANYALKCMVEMLRHAGQLGLTPSARSRIEVDTSLQDSGQAPANDDAGAEPADPTDSYFN